MPAPLKYPRRDNLLVAPQYIVRAIQKEMKLRGITGYQLSRRIGVHENSMYRMLNSGAMQSRFAEACMKELGLEIVPKESR